MGDTDKETCETQKEPKKSVSPAVNEDEISKDVLIELKDVMTDVEDVAIIDISDLIPDENLREKVLLRMNACVKQMKIVARGVLRSKIRDKLVYQSKYGTVCAENRDLRKDLDKIQGQKMVQDYNLKIRVAVEGYSNVFKAEKRRINFKYDHTKIKDLLLEDDVIQEKLFQLWDKFLRDSPNNLRVRELINRIENFSFKKVYQQSKLAPTDPAGKKTLFAKLISQINRAISVELHVSTRRLKPVTDVRLLDDTLHNVACNVLLGDFEKAEYTIAFSDGTKIGML